MPKEVNRRTLTFYGRIIHSLLVKIKQAARSFAKKLVEKSKTKQIDDLQNLMLKAAIIVNHKLSS